MARYLQLLRLESENYDPLEILVDTTGTERNLNCVAVIRSGDEHNYTEQIGRFLADKYRCPYLS